MARPRFRSLAHTADLRLAAWGRSEDELIANAVAGACSAALGGRRRGPVRAWAAIEPWPALLAGRLVSAINQALFHLYVRRELAVELRCDEAGGRLGLAELRTGVRPAIEIKAATFHALAVRRRHGLLRAIVTLDL